MTTVYIGDELVPVIMRVTRGADRKFTLRRHDDTGTPQDWGAEVYINIVLDPKKPPTRVDAVVVGETADMQIESEILDQVRTTTTWQIIMSQTGEVALETPLMVGTFERQDGKP